MSVLHLEHLYQESQFKSCCFRHFCLILLLFIFWNSTASTRLTTECPTQGLSCRISFKKNLLEEIQNGVFLVSLLSGTTYYNLPQWIWNFQSFQWSHANVNRFFRLYYYSSWSLSLNLGFFVGGLLLWILFIYH